MATATPIVGAIAARLVTTIATTLRVSSALVAAETRFTSLGMDSLAAIELTAAIEDALGLELPIDAVHQFDDLASLTRFIEGRAALQPSRELHARMRRDAVLPPDIIVSRPVGVTPRRTATARNVLLTGATGFVGAHLLRTLLDETPVTVTCVVRPDRRGASDRVRRNLARYGLWRDADASRIRVVRGDLSAFLLGWRAETFIRLAEEVDAIYHGGAAVNWVHGYDALRDANVVGTREILRLACTGEPKPVHFLSSLGVCYSTRGPRVVDENDDMLAALDGLHLGYAQSKCVAESLVRAAGARGLPVTITRPALVSGESRSGRSNTDDLLARFIAGCIRLGAAPDLDWRVDCVPVDHVARAVVRLSRAHDEGIATAHLTNPRSRHWRECVLWMRLCGYDIELLPYREWLDVLRGTIDPTNPLAPLRPFFLRPVAGEDKLTLPELFEESRRSSVATRATDRRLGDAKLHCPALDARLLDRYFAAFVADGIVPATPRHNGRAASASGAARDLPSIDDALPDITASLAAHYRDDTLRLRQVSVAPFDTDDSIVAELTSWRHGVSSGLFRVDVTLDGRPTTPSTLELVLKAKPSDQHVVEVAEAVARLASPELGERYARCRDDVGFTRSHVRELAVYAHADARLRRNTPLVHAVVRDDAAAKWMIVMERVDDAARSPAADVARPWPAAEIDVALHGLAEIHAVWYQRDRELRAEAWLGPVRDARRFAAMAPLWVELARHARRYSAPWQNAELASIHERLASDVDWIDVASCPRTLIHNDFNPRNITIRRGVAPRLCAYDWELATLGLPQRDFAELLAFVLSPHASRSEVTTWIERYRRLLERETALAIDVDDWMSGFRAALRELLVDRLAMYAMVDRFRPQRFLPRVVATWMALWSATAA